VLTNRTIIGIFFRFFRGGMCRLFGFGKSTNLALQYSDTVF